MQEGPHSILFRRLNILQTMTQSDCILRHTKTAHLFHFRPLNRPLVPLARHILKIKH